MLGALAGTGRAFFTWAWALGFFCTTGLGLAFAFLAMAFLAVALDLVSALGLGCALDLVSLGLGLAFPLLAMTFLAGFTACQSQQFKLVT